MKYPNLKEVVKSMLLDNFGHRYDYYVKPESEWEWPEHADELEKAAKGLTEEEVETLAGGDYDEQEELITEKPELAPLRVFLSQVFDGPLTSNFVRRG